MNEQAPDLSLKAFAVSALAFALFLALLWLGSLLGGN